mmetsp:Transcript_51106/g.101695  ORF Transcript_51106/g.101695 Transcript_51106/m.101695 type:complete len:209 (+) Transcript_51106:781-1407(+)
MLLLGSCPLLLPLQLLCLCLHGRLEALLIEMALRPVDDLVVRLGADLGHLILHHLTVLLLQLLHNLLLCLIISARERRGRLLLCGLRLDALRRPIGRLDSLLNLLGIPGVLILNRLGTLSPLLHLLGHLLAKSKILLPVCLERLGGLLHLRRRRLLAGEALGRMPPLPVLDDLLAHLAIRSHALCSVPFLLPQESSVVLCLCCELLLG